MSQDSPSCGAQMQLPNLSCRCSKQALPIQIVTITVTIRVEANIIQPVACISYCAKGTIYIFLLTLYHNPFRSCSSQGLTPKYAVGIQCSISLSTSALTSLAWMSILISNTWKFTIITSCLSQHFPPKILFLFGVRKEPVSYWYALYFLKSLYHSIRGSWERKLWSFVYWI